MQECRTVCVDPNAQAQNEIQTEAVVGNPMKLTCISCMKREEIEAVTKVNWYYKPKDSRDFRQHVSTSCTYEFYLQMEHNPFLDVKCSTVLVNLVTF